MRRSLLALSLVALSPFAATDARAWVHEGQLAPNFTKNVFGTNPLQARSLTDHAGQVVVLFLLGCT